MVSRLIAFLSIGMAVLLLALISVDAAERPSSVRDFWDLDARALIRQVKASAGATWRVENGPATACVSEEIVLQADRNVVRDRATGIAIRQDSQWLADVGMLLIETELANEGREAVDVEHVTPIDWKIPKLRENEGYTNLAHRDDAWYGSTYWTGPDWTRVGRNWQHPGRATSTIRTFLVPDDGRVTISGRVRKADVAPKTDGVRAAIRHGLETLWEAEIDGGDATGVEHDVTLGVRKGDAIRFVVGKRKAISCDTTHWDPVIAYEDGRTFRASEGFSTVQGQEGWFYQMEEQESSVRAVPRIFGLDRGGALREAPLNVGKEVVWESGEFLPFFVLATTENQNGLLVSLLDQGPWQVSAARDVEGLRIRVQAGDPTSLSPGESVELPRLAVAGYAGQWTEGMIGVEGLLQGTNADRFEELRDQVSAALRRGQRMFDDDLRASGGAEPGRLAEFGLWVMLQAEYRREDDLSADTQDAFAGATWRHLQGTAMLLDDLRSTHGTTFLKREARQLERITESIAAEGTSLDQWRAHYQRTRALKRHVVLANPLLDEFQELLFVKRVPTSYSHLVMQYYGWRARPGGGLFVLERPGYSLACRDILDGHLEGGNVLEPRLSYDGQQIVFSFVDGAEAEYDPARIGNDDPSDAGYYHIYSVGIDGSDLTQLTDGAFDDLIPAWLPDGGIVFMSTRRRGYARCFGAQFSPRWDVYTLHRMEADGSRLRTLSFHDTNEWFPAVSHTGHILYSRWDYIDRDAVTHQNLWSTRPDGTNPVAVWGNATSRPHCTFQIQPIPDSTKLVFTASAHHSITGGCLALVDPSVSNNGQAAIERITPEVAFPEAETRDIQEYYAAPWPLSEKYFLTAYSPEPLVWEPGANDANALGIYLLDKFGNRELIYRDPRIGCTNPRPITPRETPPVLQSSLPDNASPVGEMMLADVYEGLGDCPPGTIKQLRIVQIFPKTTPVANSPPIGIAREENARAILGTVPVEADGSARFLVPAEKPILFQALDEDGFAYQTMRTITYLQPGERLSCVGCHENRMSAPLRKGTLAFQRPPSEIDPGELGGKPFSYMNTVQPLLDQHCVSCHGGGKTEGDIDLTGVPHKGFSQSYWSLCGDHDFWAGGTNPKNAAEALVPRFGGRNQVQITPPGGLYGARGSRLMTMLEDGHEDVKLSPEELRRLAAWIDLNAIFYGVYLPEDQARQLRGEDVPMPEIQ